MSLPLRPMSNTAHDGIYKRLIIINDPAEAMEERHGCKGPPVTGEQTKWAVRGRVTGSLEVNFIRSAHH